MIGLNKALIVGIVSTVICWNEAHAFNFTAVGIAGYSGGSVSSNNGFTFPYHSFTYGYGALMGFSMFPNMMAQLGILYISRGFDEASSSLPSQLEVTFNTVQIPFTFHYYVIPTIALGVGGYYSYALGSIATNPVGSPASVTSSAYGPGTFSVDDYGLVASLTFKINLLPTVSLVVDGRYLYGLQNVSQSNAMTVYLRDFQVLGGVRFGK